MGEDVQFTPAVVELFMGGDFDLGKPMTVGELRQTLKGIDTELTGWGDDTEISEIWTSEGTIQVTLKKGIPQ